MCDYTTAGTVEEVFWYTFDDLVQDYTISSALAMEILQCCTKPSIASFSFITIALEIFTIVIVRIYVYQPCYGINGPNVQ